MDRGRGRYRRVNNQCEASTINLGHLLGCGVWGVGGGGGNAYLWTSPDVKTSVLNHNHNHDVKIIIRHPQLFILRSD